MDYVKNRIKKDLSINPHPRGAVKGPPGDTCFGPWRIRFSSFAGGVFSYELENHGLFCLANKKRFKYKPAAHRARSRIAFLGRGAGLDSKRKCIEFNLRSRGSYRTLGGTAPASSVFAPLFGTFEPRMLRSPPPRIAAALQRHEHHVNRSMRQISTSFPPTLASYLALREMFSWRKLFSRHREVGVPRTLG